MKKILFVGTIFLLISISVFSQSKKKWEQIQSLNSIDAYQDFISTYPEGKYVEDAKLKLAQLELTIAKQENTVAAYDNYLNKIKNKQLIHNDALFVEAIMQRGKIKREEEFLKVKETNSVIDILIFSEKYPNYTDELKPLFEKLIDENAFSIGTLDTLESFLKEHPKSKFAEQLNKKIPALQFSEAISIGTEQALITFIKSCTDPLLIKDAISRLKTYQIVDISKPIPWSSLKTVYCGSVESGGTKYSCGINFNAFNPGISELSVFSVMAGPFRYYEPNVASLVIFDWTEFDGYCVKSTNLNHQTSDGKSYYTKARVMIDGLLFEPNSTVLKKINNNEK